MQPQNQNAPQYRDVDTAIAANLQSPGEMTVSRSQRKKGSALGVIGGLLAGLALLAGGGFVAFNFIVTQPEEAAIGGVAQARFDDVLARAMDVDSVRQTITYKGGEADQGQLELILTADSDFSNPTTPRTQGTVVSRIHVGDVSVSATASYVLVGSDQYIRLDDRGYGGDFPGAASQQLPGQSVADAIKGEWLKLDDSSQTQTLLSDIFFMDSAPLASLNRAENELIVGGIADAVQEQLLAFADMQRLYTIQTAEVTTLDGAAVTKFNISLDTTKLADYLRLSSPALDSTFDPRSSLFTVYVDNQTQLPKRIEMSEAGQAVTIDYSNAGTPVEIAVPTDAASASTVTR